MKRRIAAAGFAAIFTGVAAPVAAEDVAAQVAAPSKGTEHWIELAQAGYNPMTRPVNPMLPHAPGVGTGNAEEGPDANPELGNLPDAPGAEETYYLCSACHSLAIIKQQRLSDARWDYLWNWMIEAQGMPEQDPETKERILSYLKQHFSSER